MNNIAETYGTNLIEAYKKMLDAVFLNSNTEFEDIRRELNLLGNFEIQERIIEPIVFQTQSEEISNVEQLEVFKSPVVN